MPYFDLGLYMKTGRDAGLAGTGSLADEDITRNVHKTVRLSKGALIVGKY